MSGRERNLRPERRAVLSRADAVAWAAPVAAVAVVAACGAGERADAPVWTGTRDTVGSVEVVRNPASPLHDTAAVEVERLWVAPNPVDQERRAQWERPGVVRYDAGRVYVLDRMAHHVYAVDVDTGEWLRTIGRKGGGPGEFEEPFGLAVADGRVTVGNGGSASLEVFDTAGTYVRTIRAGVMGFSLAGLDGRRFLVSGLGDQGGANYIVEPGGAVDMFTFPEAATEPPWGYDRGGRVHASGERFVRLARYRPVLYWADRNGRLTHEIHIDRPLRVPDPERIDSMVSEMRRTMAGSGLPAALIQRQTDVFRDRFRYSPRFGAPRFDAATGRYTLLERTPIDLGGGPPTVHVIGPDGVFLASIPFDREWVDYDTDGSTLLALVRDLTTGLVRLTAYRYAYAGSRP